MDAEGRRILSVIKENASTLDLLISEILHLARIGMADLVISRIDMKTMAHSIYHEVTSPEVRAAVNIEIDNIPDCFGDSNLIRKIWSCLLDNAVKFTAGRDNRSIAVYAVSDDRETTYHVRDNGIGFNPAYRAKLFLPFERLHSQAEYGGIGTGLALVRRIVELHGGRVGGEGEEGKGAVFWFSLPKTKSGGGSGDVR